MKPMRSLVDFFDFAGEFMAENTRISEVRLIALKRMEVGSADSDSTDSNKRFTLAARRRYIFPKHKLIGFFTYDSLQHVFPF